MAELIVLVFDDEAGALRARDRLLEIREQRLVQLADAAVAVRGADGKLKIKQLTNLVGTGAFGGGFLGVLIGLIFAVPFLGLAVGAAAGVAHGLLADFGVDDDFIKEVGSTIEPGQSALFLLAHRANLFAVLDELEPFSPQVLQTSLSDEDEAKLREAFGAE